ncbi:hypothetical protein VaNZ11_010790 [Volvox africanus]|uniref:Uncharacterized protein n=1 Tax=Volvox africanus TaxID=51714 RepID=A0ABQ5SB08_9CHLO|nr:hypothetical protein VaNZ11_010790 [Volvox africanus]
MLADLFLPNDAIEPPQHRERVVALLNRGYDVIASVHSATGRLTPADKCSLESMSDAALASASADAKRTLLLRSGAVVTTITAQPGSSLFTAPTSAAKGVSATRAAAAAAVAAAPLPPCHLRQLKRLNFIAADVVQTSQLVSSRDILRSYDIVSISTTNERVLHQACTYLPVDVISLELWQNMCRFKPRADSIQAALKRGIYFEICYAPALRDPSARRSLFCNAQMLVRLTRGRNILISSSARSASEVRSPLEVVHMATMFGMTLKQAQDAVSLAPRAVLANAAARLAGRRTTTVPASAAAAAAAAELTAAATAVGAEATRAVEAVDVEMQDAPFPETQAAPAVGTQQQQAPQQQAHGGAPAGGRVTRKRTAAVR